MLQKEPFRYSREAHLDVAVRHAAPADNVDRVGRHDVLQVKLKLHALHEPKLGVSVTVLPDQGVPLSLDIRSFTKNIYIFIK